MGVCRDGGFSAGIDGLALRVQGSVGAHQALHCAHVFFNRHRDKVKILRYDRNGWWLLYKRLERGSFACVAGGQLSEADLRLVLEGVDLSVRRLRPVSASKVA